MPHQTTFALTTALLVVALAMLTVSNVAEGNPCEAGNNAIVKEMGNVAHARASVEKNIEEVETLRRDLDHANSRVEIGRTGIASMKCLFGRETSAECAFLYQTVETEQQKAEMAAQKLKELTQNPSWQAWENAQRRMTNLVKRVAEECTGEARERWNRERREQAEREAKSNSEEREADQRWRREQRERRNREARAGIPADAPNTCVAGIARLDAFDKELETESKAINEWRNEKYRIKEQLQQARNDMQALGCGLAGPAQCQELNRKVDQLQFFFTRMEERETFHGGTLARLTPEFDALKKSVKADCEREEQRSRESETGHIARARCDEANVRVKEMEANVDALRGAGNVPALRAAMENLNIATAEAKTDCDRVAQEATPDPASIPSCAVGQERIKEMKYKIETARQSSKSFNYGESSKTMTGLLAAVSQVCERERVASAADNCANGKSQMEAARRTGDKARLAQLLKTVSELCASEVNQASTNQQAVCDSTNGPGYVVGHVLEDGRFFCKPTQATADAWCVANNAAGYTATNIDERGSFGCLPSQRVADAWCNSNNEGSGWSATIKADGSYDCNKSTAGQHADAAADCRNRFGNRLIRVYERNGQWYCEHRTQPQQRVGRREPGYDPRAAAAAAAATATIIGILSRGSGPRSGGAVPRQKCHLNPYTRLPHCRGSN